MPRPWALLLSAYLLLWVPLTFASELLTALPSLARRGPAALAEVLAHGIVAVGSATAGRMVLTGAPAASGAAATAVVFSTATMVQSLFWTALPRQFAPGEAAPLTALVTLHAAFWLWLIRRYAGGRTGGQ